MSKLMDEVVEAHLAESLAKQKVFSVLDFLRADIEKLVDAGLRRENAMKLKEEFTNRFLPPVINGDDYYRMQLKKCSIMQTSISGLDELLEGGLKMGTLLEVCGCSGSGKTQLCLNVAINLVAKYKIDVLYIDTKKDVVASHLASLIEDLGFQEDSDDILERIKVARSDTMYSLISTLHHLQENYRTRKRIKVLVIDSIASLYYTFIGMKSGERNNGLSLLNHVASLLKNLAVQNNMAVFLVNLGSRWSSEEGFEGDPGDEDGRSTSVKSELDEPLKPAMGKYWAHVPNTRLFLSKDLQPSGTANRTLSVHKSDYLASDKNSKIEIKHNGTIK